MSGDTPVRAEQLPVGGADRILVADRERDQHARVRRSPQRVAMAFAQMSRAADAGLRPAAAPDRRSAPAARPHVAGRADAALEQPGLVVEAVRVGAAVGPLAGAP